MLENDDLEELTNEIRRLIESNKAFLERVNDDDYESEDVPGEPEADSESDPEDFEEL